MLLFRRVTHTKSRDQHRKVQAAAGLAARIIFGLLSLSLSPPPSSPPPPPNIFTFRHASIELPIDTLKGASADDTSTTQVLLSTVRLIRQPITTSHSLTTTTAHLSSETNITTASTISTAELFIWIYRAEHAIEAIVVRLYCNSKFPLWPPIHASARQEPAAPRAIDESRTDSRDGTQSKKTAHEVASAISW